MKDLSVAATVITLSCCVGVACGPQAKRGQHSAGESERFAGKFASSESIWVDIRLGVADDEEVIRVRQVRFERSGDAVRAAVRIAERMAADAKWRLSVELRDSHGQHLGRAEEIIATQQFMRLSRVSAMGDVWLWLGPWERLSNAAGFVLTLERAADAAAVTAGLRRIQPAAEGRGSLSLDVKVVDRQGRPVEPAYVRLWRAVRTDDEQWEGAFSAYPNNPRAVGYVWHDPLSERTWEPWLDNSYDQPERAEHVFEKLLPGEYRVSAVRPMRDPSPDPTPIGVSQIIRLERDDRRASVTVPLEGEAELRVRLTDAGTGKPLDGALVLLMREDGFPLGAEYRSDADGFVRYARLAPGTYWLRASHTIRGQQPVDYGGPERVRVMVESDRSNRVELPLRAVEIDEAEVYRRWPWCVTGKVTDNAGEPMAGVEVTAHCGHGTLFQTDVAVSRTDGCYTLRPMPGVRIKNDATGEWGAGVQAATVSAHKDGYYEANLSRQGNLLMAQDPRDRKASWGPTTAGVLVPKEPFRVDFVMLPAATISGRLLDGSGQFIAKHYVSVDAEELPPSSSVRATMKTDATGWFRFTEVPTGSVWLSTRTPEDVMREVRTETMRCEAPRVYEVELVYHPGPPPRLAMRPVTQP